MLNKRGLSAVVQSLCTCVFKGALQLHIVAARELKAADISLRGKKHSDPYCVVYGTVNT